MWRRYFYAAMSATTQRIEKVASQSKKVWTEEGGHENQDLKSLIEVDQYLEGKSAASTVNSSNPLGALGIRMFKGRPPGAVSEHV